MLLLVNICLISVFTYFVYKKNTKHQKLDLTIIALLQVTAIAFGSYSIYAKHPVYAVFAIDRFTLINAINATPESAHFGELNSSLLSKTKFVFAKMPRDEKKRNDIFMGFMFKGEPDLDGRPEFYEPYSEHKDKVLEKSINEDEILADVVSKQQLEMFFKKHGESNNSYSYLPLQHNDQDVIWVLDNISAKPIGILNIDPWQFSRPKKSSKEKTPRRWLI